MWESSRIKAPSQILKIRGSDYEQVLKCGNPGAEKRIRDWIYDYGNGRKTQIYDPDGRGFFYLYAEVV
jgi:hypothetical protein